MEWNCCTWIAILGSLFTVSDSFLNKHDRTNFVPEEHRNWNNLDHINCGFSMQQKIIGGKTVSMGMYPWLVRVGNFRLANTHNMHSSMAFPCAGAILNRYFVLTATHCFRDPNNQLDLVRVGEYDITTNPDCFEGFCAPPVQDIRISQYYTPRFEAQEMENDITLIELEDPIRFSETVLPICLPPRSISSSNFTGQYGEVAGWGITNIHRKSTPRVLKAVRLQIIEDSSCATYKKRHTRFPFNIFCAGGEAGRDSCGGDSGGPFMVPFSEHGGSKYYIIGVVSYGPEACGETEQTGVYTFVPQFERWILNFIDKN